MPAYLFPQISTSQQIGYKGMKAVEASIPDEWNVIRQDTQADVGIDLLVQTRIGTEVQYLFHAQVKSSTTANADNPGYFSVSLKATTLNYYLQIRDPKILLFADLSRNSNPSKCPVYYLWLDDEIRSRLNNASRFDPSQQKSYTFRVPKKNKVTRQLNVIGYLSTRQAEHDEIDAILNLVGATRSQAILKLREVSERIDSIDLRAISSDSTRTRSASKTSNPGTIAHALRECDDALRKYDFPTARQYISRLRERNLRQQQLAELRFYEGRLALYTDNWLEASSRFDEATKLHTGNRRYFQAWAECQLTLADSQSDPQSFLRSVLQRVTRVQHWRHSIAAARIHIALHEYAKALNVLRKVPTYRSCVPKAICLHAKGSWRALKSHCDKQIADARVIDPDKLLLTTLQVHAEFNLAYSRAPLAEGTRFPPTGLPGVYIPQLIAAWELGRSALDKLRVAGWPPASEILAELLAMIAAMLNHQDDLVVHYSEVAEKYPANARLQSALEYLSIYASRPDLLLIALSRQTDSTEVRIKKAFAHYQRREYTDVVTIGRSLLSPAHDNHRLYASMLGICACCAHEILDFSAEESFVSKLKSREEWKPEFHIYEFVHVASSKPLERERAIQELFEACEALPDAAPLHEQFLNSVSISSDTRARQVIQVSELARRYRLLSFRETITLIRAHASLSDWSAANALLSDAIQQFGLLAELRALRAMILESVGSADLALKELGEIVSSGRQTPKLIGSYVYLAQRCGLIGLAIDQAQRLLEVASTRDEKASAVHLLVVLELRNGDRNHRAAQLAWEFGSLIDPSIEKEEGVFIQLFMFATLSQSVSIPDQRKRDFQNRVDSFCARFPNSEFLRRFDLPEENQATAFMEQLKKVTGIDDARLEMLKSMERQLDSGQIAVPLSWRPATLLYNIRDLPQLWAVAKNSRVDLKRYHLYVSMGDEAPRKFEGHSTLPPLLDLITLLVLADLDLLSNLFSIFNEIAISKETLEQLQLLCDPIAGSINPSTPISVRETLKQQLPKIQQPHSNIQDSDVVHPGIRESNQIKELIRTGRYQLYSDDAVLRAYVLQDCQGVNSITTIEVLGRLQDKDILHARVVTEKLSTLFAWNVWGVTISVSQFFHALPMGIDSAPTLATKIDSLEGSLVYRRIIDALWDIDQPYAKTLRFVALIVAELCKQHQVSDVLISAIAITWLNKVRIRIDNALESPDGHTARLVMAAAQHLRTIPDNFTIKRLWNVYGLVIQHIVGLEMETTHERRSIRMLAVRIAETITDPQKVTLASEITETLKRGLTTDTEDYENFISAYETVRIAKEKALRSR